MLTHGQVNSKARQYNAAMDTRIRIAGIVGAIIVSIVILTSPSPGIPLPEPSTSLNAGNDFVIVLVTDLDEPRAIATHGSQIFIAEKSGVIRLVDDGNLLDRPLVTLRAARAHDGGLVGIALHPEFDDNQLLYAYMTYHKDGKLWNRVMQIHVNGQRADDIGTIFDKIPGADFSNGGAIAFGPDGKLYVGTGATSETSRLAQDPDSLAGKILRLDDDGTIPKDNPRLGSAVYATGFHDPVGIDWDFEDRLIIADAGSTKNDEINIVEAGANYGWPDEQCLGQTYVSAVMCFDPSLGPGGITVYSGEILAPHGSLIVGSLRANGIYTLDLKENTQDAILGGLGRIRDVVSLPDGTIYAITSNTDNRGFPNSSDDLLLQVLK